MTSASRYSYGPWHGGPDPLAPPADLSAALDEIGQDVMDGASPRAAMRELLRRGLADAPGMDELARRIWQRRAEITRRHRLDGTLQQVRELLDKALTAERRALFPDPDDDARFREAQLDALPPDTARAVDGWTPRRTRERAGKVVVRAGTGGPDPIPLASWRWRRRDGRLWDQRA